MIEPLVFFQVGDKNYISDDRSLSDEASYKDDHKEPLEGSMLGVSINDKGTAYESKSSKRPTCQECGKTFSTRSHLKRHKYSHIPNMIRCSICNMYFKTEDDKLAHVRQKHSGNNICHTCGRSYIRIGDLNVHMKTHDKNATANFTCSFEGCNKSFVKRTVYQDHLNIHTGEEPYKCLACGSTFKSRYQRNDHYKLCVGLTTITCDICQKTFNHRSFLHNHKAMMHFGQTFRCGCGATFKFPSGLKRHKKTKNHL